MQITIGIILFLMELVTACYLLWLSYITARWVAETIAEPIWWKVHDFLLGFYLYCENDQWLTREEADGSGNGIPGEPIEPIGPGPAGRDRGPGPDGG